MTIPREDCEMSDLIGRQISLQKRRECFSTEAETIRKHLHSGAVNIGATEKGLQNKSG